MKRKYSIFISSSYKDLQAARNDLILAILKEGHIPNGMEMFHANDARNLAMIHECIDECDIFVLLVGARLGSEISAQDATTYIQWEYNLAVTLKKPTFAFLLNKEEYKQERDQLSMDDPERKHDDPLNEFREYVQQPQDGVGRKIVEFFSYRNTADLRSNVLSTIRSAVSGRSTGGWIQSIYFEKLHNRISLDESVSHNPFFRRYADRLSEFETLSKRTLLQDRLKIGIAEYFWKLYLPRIALKGIRRLYFESGSSIAYVGDSFISVLKSEEWTRRLVTDLRIATNNILILLDFLLMSNQKDPIDVQLNPNGEAEPYYGATFGNLTKAIELPPPKKQGRPMHSDATKHVDEMVANFKAFLGDAGLVLMAASGFELRTDSSFFGPHARSYYNMLIKRSLLITGNPIILFLDETKCPKNFVEGVCYSVFGPDLKWEDVITHNAFAVAIAAETEDRITEISNHLGRIGLTYQEPLIREGEIWPLIASNEPFNDQFGSERLGI